MSNVPVSNSFWGNGPSAPEQWSNKAGDHNAGNDTTVPNGYTASGICGSQRGRKSIRAGAFVLGVKFEGGVMIAADAIPSDASYGSLALSQHDAMRTCKINERVVLGAGGDFTDFLSVKCAINEKIIVDEYCGNGDIITMKPIGLYTWLTRLMYDRRCRMDPLWLDLIVGGVDEQNVPFLGHVDMRGCAYVEDAVVAAFGGLLELPLMLERSTRDNLLTVVEASEILRNCLEFLYNSDTRAYSKYTVAVCTKDICAVKGPFKVNENWQLAEFVRSY